MRVNGIPGGYIPSIDGLRALAVLAVMLYHLNPALLPGGFSGVDVFFVISGFVVSGSLARDRYSSFGRFALGFYARRILRLFPVLIACLLVTTLASVLFVPEAWLSSTSEQTGRYAFFGLSNFALVWLDDGYFSPRVEFNPFAHTWSLAVEEQFYLVFPLLFFLWLRSQAKTIEPKHLPIDTVLIGLCAASLAYAWWQTLREPTAAFYLLPSRFWELGAGALLFQLHAAGRYLPSRRHWRQASLLLGLMLIAFGFCCSSKADFPLPWALPTVLGTLLVIMGIVGVQEKQPMFQGLLDSPIAVWIGKRSYGLYLWHWPVYALMRWTVGLESLWQYGLAVAISIFTAACSYRCLEVPIRHGVWTRYRPRWQVVITGLASITLAWQLGGVLLNARPSLSLNQTRDRQAWYPLAWDSGLPRLADFSGGQLFTICDSHAGAYTTMLRMLTDQYGIGLRQYFTGGCPVGSLMLSASEATPDCAEQVERYLATIEASATPGDMVFLASLRVDRFADQYILFPLEAVLARRNDPRVAATRAQALAETAKLIERLEARGLWVIIDAPKPVFRWPAFRCVDWFNRHNPICVEGPSMDRDLLLAHREPVMTALRTLSARFPKLLVWDPFPILCPTSPCTVLDGDKPLFFDSDHLSAIGNRRLYPSFQQLLAPHLQPRAAASHLITHVRDN